MTKADGIAVVAGFVMAAVVIYLCWITAGYFTTAVIGMMIKAN